MPIFDDGMTEEEAAKSLPSEWEMIKDNRDEVRALAEQIAETKH